MCEFVSWIEHDGRIYYLNDTCMNTKEGRELKKYLGDNYWTDIPGHGAIRHYYSELKGWGENCECTDFSTPDNFPPEIVVDIKAGRMRTIGLSLELLNQQAWANYEAVLQPAWVKYKEVQQQALTNYQAVLQQAWVKYKEVRQQAFWDLFKSPENRIETWK